MRCASVALVLLIFCTRAAADEDNLSPGEVGAFVNAKTHHGTYFHLVNTTLKCTPLADAGKLRVEFKVEYRPPEDVADTMTHYIYGTLIAENIVDHFQFSDLRIVSNQVPDGDGAESADSSPPPPSSEATVDRSSLIHGDDWLNAIYARIRTHLSPKDRESLKKEEIAWIKYRDSLPPEKQLDAIKARIEQLEQKYGGPPALTLAGASDQAIKSKSLGYWQSPRHAYLISVDSIMYMCPRREATTKNRWDVRGGLFYQDGEAFRIVRLNRLEFVYQELSGKGDRGFCSFGCLAALQQLGLDSLMRLHQARRLDWRRGQRLGKADRPVEWPKPRCRPRLLSAEGFAALPATLQVRQVRLQARLKGFRTRTLVLVTTLVDPVAYPAEALAELYLQRWGVELHFREREDPDALRRLTVTLAADDP